MDTPLVADENKPLDAIGSHGETEEFLKSFHVLPGHRISVFKEEDNIIFDSGASMSGTGNESMLDNKGKCDAISIAPAFGEPIRSSVSGTMGAFKLPTLLIKEMKNQTIVSVSQLAKRGHICVFTNRGFRVFTAESAMKAMSLLATSGKEVMRGAEKDGLYVIPSL